MRFRKINTTDATMIAKLQKHNVSSGFLSSLDDKNLAAIYSSIINQKKNFGILATDHKIPVGFILLTENCGSLYQDFIKNNFWLGVKIFSTKIFSPVTIRKIIDHFFYPRKRKSLPEAELLSIAVEKACRRQGVAKKLAIMGIKELRSRKIKEFITIVGTRLTASNNFMQSIGGKKIAEIEVHRGGKSNVYIWKL